MGDELTWQSCGGSLHLTKDESHLLIKMVFAAGINYKSKATLAWDVCIFFSRRQDQYRFCWYLPLAGLKLRLVADQERSSDAHLRALHNIRTKVYLLRQQLKQQAVCERDTNTERRLWPVFFCRWVKSKSVFVCEEGIQRHSHGSSWQEETGANGADAVYTFPCVQTGAAQPQWQGTHSHNTP